MPSLIHSVNLAAWLSSVMAFSPLAPHTRSLPANRITNFKYNHAGRRLWSSIADDIPSDVNDEEGDSTGTTTATATTPPPTASDILEGARANVLSTAQSLLDASLTGVFLTTPMSINELDLACRQLEAIAPSLESAESLIGDWDLVCTARAPKIPISMGSSETGGGVWDLLPKPPKVQDTLNKSLSIIQRIRTSEEDDATINRIDHVLEYTPLTLFQLIPKSSPLASLRSWNVNPLEISRSKISLIHKAEVESFSPVLRTQLSLQSVGVTVAGTSQYLEPEGADVLGLNFPSLGEWSNAGAFDTTFCDGAVRISRGSTLGLEELRVFVKRGSEDVAALGVVGSSVKDLEDDDDDDDDEDEENPTLLESSVRDERVQNLKEAVQDVKSAVEKLDSDVKGKVQDAAKGVQEVVEEDLKDISDKVTKVKNVVIGKEKEIVAKVEETKEEAVAEPVEAVAEPVEEATKEEESEKDEDSEEEMGTDSSVEDI